MLRAVLRALRMLVSAAPVAAPAYVATGVLRGVAPYVMIGAAAQLVGLAPDLAASADARLAARDALIVFGLASITARVMTSVGEILAADVGFRLDAAFESDRIAAASALPGLEHFESAEHADRLALSARAAQFPRLAINSAVYAVLHGSASAAALVIIGRLGWWAPALIAATSVPVIVTGWQHAGRRNIHSRMISPEMRRGMYYWALPLVAAREIRLFGTDEWLRDRQSETWTAATDEHLADVRREYRTQTWLAAAKAVAMGIPLVVAVQRYSSGDLDLATFSAVVTAAAAVSGPLRWFETTLASLREDIAFLPDAFDVADLAAVDPRLHRAGHRVPSPAPESGIRFDGVSFRYPGTQRDILQGLDLFLPAGQVTALVGENGAGKSTVVKLLCRMYDPTAGRITLDGVDLREFDLEELRRRSGVLTQQYLRLPADAAVNVGVGCIERIDDHDLVVAASADVGADAVVARLGDGWSTMLVRDLGGVDLSGGEWQRLGLARVMAARRGRAASVLVLDEPMAALDVRVEHEIFERFASLTRGATTLLISHRYSTVQMANLVAVMEAGRIVEHGTHDELVAEDTSYRRMYRLQAARFTGRTETE